MSGGLHFDGERLWLGSRLSWFTSAARLDAEGVLRVDRRRRTTRYLWRHYDDGLRAPEAWYLTEESGRYGSWGVIKTRGSRSRIAGGAPPRIAFALVEYVVRCPAARLGLDHPAGLARLVQDLNAWQPARLPLIPALPFTERWEIRKALEPVIEQVTIVIDGRPVGGQPLPDLEAITWAAKPHLDPEVFHDHILDEAKRMLSATPWPFETLMTA